MAKEITSELEKQIEDLEAKILPSFARFEYIAPLFLLIALAFFLLIHYGHGDIAVSLFFSMAGTGFLFFYVLSKKYRDEFMADFALLIDGHYRPNGSVEEFDSKYFQTGEDPHISNVVSGIYKNHPFDIFDFNCYFYMGKSRRQLTITACRIETGANAPHIFLDSRNDRLFLNGVSNFEVPNSGNLTSISPEGDFHKYFDLYGPKEYEIETLQIFEPHVMAGLIDNSQHHSMELLDNHIYIFSHNAANTGQDLFAIYNLIDFVIAKIEPELRNIKIVN